MADLKCSRCGGTDVTQGFIAGPTGGPWWFDGPPREVRRLLGFTSGKGRHAILAAACESCGHLDLSRGPRT